MPTLRRSSGLPFLAFAGALLISACSSTPATAPPPNLDALLERDTGTRWLVYTDPTSREVRFLAPATPVSFDGATTEDKARAFLARYGTELHATGKADEIRVEGEATDRRGNHHLRFAHFVPGTDVPVFDAGTTVHFNAQGALYWAAPGFRADLDNIDVKPTITEESAKTAAIAHVKASCGAVTEPRAEASTLGVVSGTGGAATLVFRVSVVTDGARCMAPSVLIDAKLGTPLRIEETAHSIGINVVAAGSRFFRMKTPKDVKTISVALSGAAPATVQMVSDDPPSSQTITRLFSTGQIIQTTDLAHWDQGSEGEGAAADAHFNVRQGLAFLRPFAQRFAGHRGAFVNPLSRDVQVFVHDNSPDNDDGANAFAVIEAGTGRHVVHFGDGNPAKTANALPFSAAYDVVVHELAHLITDTTSKLIYAGESGALNESFSDVMGAAAEHAVAPNDAANFLIGEDLYIKEQQGPVALRSMTAPAQFGSDEDRGKDHVEDMIPCTAEPSDDNDRCGVHSNSGIPNRAFSLLVAGGSLTKLVDGKPAGVRPIGVPLGIGWADATEITYWATTGLGPSATFAQAALAQVAESRSFEAIVPVTCAWRAVGVQFPPELDIFLAPTARACVPPAAPPGSSALCTGRGNAIVCDPIARSSAVHCKNGVLPDNPDVEACADNTQACISVSPTDPTAVKDANGSIVCN